ncbi:MAG: hypothetical protein ABWX57_11550, partial [Aeromicrobium sp.]
SFATVRAAALAWVEEALVHQVDASCEHPLTTLSTAAHVRSRLGDVYRGAERDGTRAADDYAMVVVELPRLDPGNELEQELRSLEVAEAMRMVYAGDETIAQLSPRRFAALAGIERADAVTVRLLALMLEQVLGDESQARLWVEHLPSSADGVATMLAGLTT